MSDPEIPGKRQPATARFETRDSAEPRFWDERVARGFMPWDADAVPEDFIAFARSLTPVPTVIPGCGIAHEAIWLAQHDWPVAAFDFSATTVRAARAVATARLGPASEGDGSADGGERVARLIVQADFFEWTPPAPPGWVYERAFLCALPPRLRDAYAARLASWLAPGALLAGYFLVGEEGRGPPFPMPEAALHALLTPAFELVEHRVPVRSLPVFGSGERWMVWRRRV
ncbi:class I SAM-dependent methyltransferase [Chitinasiproducens palmae]|uniref:Thiopurine S-methyltransferase n=1 Tax=Chitinasiproducens palmae TaxID=1770053 RepID=A0A1H2PNB1_9BURK|nr:hypothetical protein [Chitinasiproducens palmae]SDV48167.1 thiopurine S-methyltransferase [Chitinasiproducens palmae]